MTEPGAMHGASAIGDIVAGTTTTVGRGHDLVPMRHQVVVTCAGGDSCLAAAPDLESSGRGLAGA